MKKTRLTALILVIALLLCACVSKEESAYRAAKQKLETARNLGGGLTAEYRDGVWQEALEALEAVGDYEDAPALADEAREYFYWYALWWFWEINDHDDALDRVQAYLDRIPGYKDTADVAALKEALRLTMDGKVEEGAQIARTLPESFDDNLPEAYDESLLRNTILMLDDCRMERWKDAVEKAEPLYRQTLNDGNGNDYLTRRSCMQRLVCSSGLDITENTSVSYMQTSDGLKEITSTVTVQLDGAFENILLRYYAQQTDLGNDISKLELCPCELGCHFVESPFGEIDLSDLYWDRAQRMEESLEKYGVAADYAKPGVIRKNKVATFKMVNSSPVIDGGYRYEIEVTDGRVPTPPVEITGNGICFLTTNNDDDGVKVDVDDLRYRFAPASLADSVESARYVCRIYREYTQTHNVRSSDGGQGGLYDNDTTVQLIDLATGETLAACQYHESQSNHESERDEVLNSELLPALREVATIYPLTDDAPSPEG